VQSIVVAVDCGEGSFCERHGETAPNEVRRYYGVGSLEHLWRNAADQNRLVNSSGEYAPEGWARQLAAIICAG
jgi:hypothetical protein